jgi:hypothetical protein
MMGGVFGEAHETDAGFAVAVGVEFCGHVYSVK